MALVYCPECDVEVPVGDDGRDFLGHAVAQPADPAQTPPEAPQPWVFSVDVAESDELHLGSVGEGLEDLDVGSLEAAVAELGLIAQEAGDDIDAIGAFEDAVDGPAIEDGASVGEAGHPQTPFRTLDISEFGLDLAQAPQPAAPTWDVPPDQELWAVDEVPTPRATPATATEANAHDHTNAPPTANAHDDQVTGLDPSRFVARPSGQRRGLFGRR